MKRIAERLREAGYKYTTPRRLVAEVLSQAEGHMSANEIWDAARDLDESVGRMSVYRTLDLFTQLSIIRPAPRNAADSRAGLVYVVMHEGHHHHIVCQGCHQIIHFENCGLDTLIADLERTYGYRIESHLLEFFGWCEDCRASTTQTPHNRNTDNPQPRPR